MAVATESAESAGGFSLHNIRIEAGIPLGGLGVGADFRAAYGGFINDIWSWSAVVETHLCAYITGVNVSLLGDTLFIAAPGSSWGLVYRF